MESTGGTWKLKIACCAVGDLVSQSLDHRAEVFVIDLARRLPWRAIAEPDTDHRVMIVDLDFFAFAEDDGLQVGVPQQLQHLGVVVIAADHEAFDAASRQPRLGEVEPRREPFAGKLVEQAIDGRGVGSKRLVLILIHDLAVVAERSEPVLEALEVGRPLETLGLTHQMRPKAAIALADDGNGEFADHVAAHDQDVGLIVLCGVDKLAEDALGAVKIGSKE